MGLWVSNMNYVIYPDLIRPKNYEDTVIVQDTDDFTTEECTIRELVKYAEKLRFENLVGLDNGGYKLDKFFRTGALRRIESVGMLLYVEGIKDDWGHRKDRLHVFVDGLRYEIDCDVFSWSMPSFTKDCIKLDSMYCRLPYGTYRNSRFNIHYKMDDSYITIYPYSGRISYFRVYGERCTEASFLSGLMMGV